MKLVVYSTFPKPWLKQAIKDSHSSATALSETLGLSSSSAITAMQNGVRDISAAEALKIARFFHFSPESVMSACETEGVAPVPESRQGTEYHKEGIIEAITGLEEYLADNNLSLPPQVKAYLVVELLEEVYKVPAEQRSAKIIQFIPPYLKGLRAISA